MENDIKGVIINDFGIKGKIIIFALISTACLILHYKVGFDDGYFFNLIPMYYTFLYFIPICAFLFFIKSMKSKKIEIDDNKIIIYSYWGAKREEIFLYNVGCISFAYLHSKRQHSINFSIMDTNNKIIFKYHDLGWIVNKKIAESMFETDRGYFQNHTHLYIKYNEGKIIQPIIKEVF